MIPLVPFHIWPKAVIKTQAAYHMFAQHTADSSPEQRYGAAKCKKMQQNVVAGTRKNETEPPVVLLLLCPSQCVLCISLPLVPQEDPTWGSPVSGLARASPLLAPLPPRDSHPKVLEPVPPQKKRCGLVLGFKGCFFAQ